MLVIFLAGITIQVFAQEEIPKISFSFEDRGLIFNEECNELCGFNVQVAGEMFSVNVSNDSEICQDIEDSGIVDESADFISDKCMMLCGFPESSMQQVAPNFKQCVKCVDVKQICKVFNDGQSHCWAKPGAINARIEYCLEKAEACYNKCRQ